MRVGRWRTFDGNLRLSHVYNKEQIEVGLSDIVGGDFEPGERAAAVC